MPPVLSLALWLLLILVLWEIPRLKYRKSSNAGAFFIEKDRMVLNTGIPYPIPLNEIEQVELQYNAKALESSLSYVMWIRVTRKNGKVKRVFYKGYGTAALPFPSDMKAALEEKGVRVVLVDS